MIRSSRWGAGGHRYVRVPDRVSSHYWTLVLRGPAASDGVMRQGASGPRLRRSFGLEPIDPTSQYWSGTNFRPSSEAWSSYAFFMDRLGSFTFSRGTFL